jgi:ketosteroid isomerase-like protein
MKSDLVNSMFAAVESNDVDTYVSYFTEDAVYKVGNFDPVIGPEGIRQFAAPVLQAFSKVTHDIKNMWEVGDTVIIELEVTYTRKDGKVAKLPCMDIIRFEGDKVKSLQAYLDVSPAFG